MGEVGIPFSYLHPIRIRSGRTDESCGNPHGSGWKAKEVSNSNIPVTSYVEVIHLYPKQLIIKHLFWGKIADNTSLRAVLCCSDSNSQMQWESQAFCME